jgi:hypothetical protein
MAIPTPPPTEPTMSHTTVKAIAERLNSLLEIDKYADLALNGLR